MKVAALALALIVVVLQKDEQLHVTAAAAENRLRAFNKGEAIDPAIRFSVTRDGCVMPVVSVFDEVIARLQQKPSDDDQRENKPAIIAGEETSKQKRGIFRQSIARFHSKQQRYKPLPNISFPWDYDEEGYPRVIDGNPLVMRAIARQIDPDDMYRKRADSDGRYFLAKLIRNNNKQKMLAGRSKRIVGGQEIAYGQWPFLVSIRFKSQDQPIPDYVFYDHLCGGTLIHPQFVLTAMHCFEPSEGFPGLTTNPEDWAVQVGEHNMLANEEDEELIPLSGITSHLEDKRQSQLNGDDIILLKLSRPVRLSRYVRPICLPLRDLPDPSPGKPCLTAGWGFEKEDATEHTYVPHHVQLPLANRTSCQSIYDRYAVVLSKDMLCAGGHSEGGKDSCRFDSGGPLMCQNDDGTWNYIGIVSFGAGCGHGGIPGIYTRVVSHLDWIEKVIAESVSN